MKIIRNDISEFTLLFCVPREDVYKSIRNEIKDKLLKLFPEEYLWMNDVRNGTEQGFPVWRFEIALFIKGRVAVNLLDLHNSNLFNEFEAEFKSADIVAFLKRKMSGYNQSYRWYASNGAVHDSSWLKLK